jgi:hypothetical protein
VTRKLTQTLVLQRTLLACFLADAFARLRVEAQSSALTRLQGLPSKVGARWSPDNQASREAKLDRPQGRSATLWGHTFSSQRIRKPEATLGLQTAESEGCEPLNGSDADIAVASLGRPLMTQTGQSSSSRFPFQRRHDLCCGMLQVCEMLVGEVLQRVCGLYPEDIDGSMHTPPIK